MKKNEINITVTLDDNNVPEKIEWVASNVGEQNTSQAMLLSMWDSDAKNMVRIDMWTKDMMMDEMKQFFHQSFLSMANTLERATGEEDAVKAMRDFAKEFGEKMKMAQKNPFISFKNK
ncbi:MAG: gliding motility protein GldC [Gallionellaceae bacterium]|nr:gliding motility protein GldC [Gallionellaceae bacterium]